MKKRNGEIIFSIMLILLLAAGSAMANPSVDLGAVSGSACAQVIVPVTLTNDGIAAIAGVGIDIGYNSQYLTPLDATIGPAAQAAGKNVSHNIVSPGLFRVLVLSGSDLSSIGNGIIAYVTFEINCAALLTSYTLQNTPSSSTADGSNVTTNGSNGSIQVTAGANTTTTTAAVRPPEEHMVSCNVCHAATIHNPVAHTSNCAGCHGDDNSPPQPSNCIICHPIGNTGTCNLVNFHDPAKGTTCLTCHVDCNASTSDDHIKQCLLCHPTDFASSNALRIHSRSGHATCSNCHTASPPAQSNFKENCVACHPLGQAEPEKCDIVDIHFPNIITTCGDCHMNCAGGGQNSSSTTTATGSTTTITGGATTTIPGGVTTTTTMAPATTTTMPPEHYSICRTCHLKDDLHAQPSHNVCGSCHKGAPGLGNVSASECIVCHPRGNPGECNLVVYHGSTCTNCHTNSICVQPSSTTTTSAPPNDHYTYCNTCHLPKDLHAEPSHNVCYTCHNGTPGAGNVTASNCAVCHPNANPGKCGLVKLHGETCSQCHSDATCPNTTTTTTAPPSTHIDLCLDCHYPNVLHEKPGHSTCSACHSGTPGTGNVAVGSCVTCHGPKCTMINDHGTTCMSCHSSCASSGTGTTTTTGSGTSTTTTAPAGSCQVLSVSPANGIKLGYGILPRIAKITVTTTTDLASQDIIDCDFQFANQPKGIYVLGAKIVGSSIQATVLFWGAKPGDYTILIGDCGSATIKLSQFWWG